MAKIDPFTGKEFSQWNSIVVPTAKVAALCGASGLLVGGAAGILRSPTPGLFAIASGLQWTLLGTTYYSCRIGILRTWEIRPSAPPQERVLPSTLAGGITGGAVGGALRGRANIIPGMIMFSLFGYAGQHAYNYLDARQNSNTNPLAHQQSTSPPNSETSKSTASRTVDQPRWKRILNSKYSPMKVLSDEEYAKVLREKALKVDVEIALVDEEMAKLEAKAEAEKHVGGREGKEP